MKVWELKVLKKIVDREIKGVWSKITEKSKTCKTLGEKFVSLVEEPERKKDISLVIQANALKRKNEETEQERTKLDETLKNMIEKKTKL